MHTFEEHEWAELEESLRKIGNGVTLDIFKAWLGLAETEARLNEKYGEDAWTLEQALDLMVTPPVQRRSSKLLYEKGTSRESKRRAGASLSGAERSYKASKSEAANETVADGENKTPFNTISKEEFEKRVAERLKEYTAYFTDIAPNDMALLRNLCYVEVNIDILNGLSALEYTKPEPDGAAISRFSYALKGLNEQARAIQRDLHIDRATRQKEQEKSTDLEEVMGIIDAAGEFAERQSVPLVHKCKVDGVLGTSTFRFGGVVWAFREIAFSHFFTCPRCGEQVIVEHIPSAEDLRASDEPEWVWEEEQAFAMKEQAVTGKKSDRVEDEDKDGD